MFSKKPWNKSQIFQSVNLFIFLQELSCVVRFLLVNVNFALLDSVGVPLSEWTAGGVGWRTVCPANPPERCSKPLDFIYLCNRAF